MTDKDVLDILLTDLNILQPDGTRTAQLTQYVDAARAFMAREGVAMAAPYSVEDAQLLVMYAAYLFRKRDTGEGMPRMLRWALNNRIFGGKVAEDAT